MRVLHDYNYNELAENLYDLFRDVEKYHVICDLIMSKNQRQGLFCMVSDLWDSFEQHMHDFDMTFDRISRVAVPPEGQEPFEVCFYPKQERERFNTPRIVRDSRKAV